MRAHTQKLEHALRGAHLHAQLRAVRGQQLLALAPDLLRELAAGRQHQAADGAAELDLRVDVGLAASAGPAGL